MSDKIRAHDIAFVLLPDFNMMALTAAIEPMRVANMLSGSKLYSWRLYSLDGNTVRASNNMMLEVEGSIREAQNFDIVFVCASWHPEVYDDRRFFGWLRDIDRQGKRIGAIDTGAIVLARAKLLEGFRATVNYDVIQGFSERYPGVSVTGHLFEIDRNKMSCSAGTAPLDMMLNLISQQVGPALAARVSGHIFHGRIRGSDELQVQLVGRYGTQVAPQLQSAIAMMEKNIESPLPLELVAKRMGMPLRRLERLFRRYFGVTPAKFYMMLRLESGRQYLFYTDMRVLDVAVACGFASQEHFARRYRRAFGCSPREDRANGLKHLKQSSADVGPRVASPLLETV